jgi:hypothetical protein
VNLHDMNLLRIETDGWYLIGALAALEIAVLALLVSLVRLRHKVRNGGNGLGSTDTPSRLNAFRILSEIERLHAGADPNSMLTASMSAEDRAFFEVSIIDALSRGSREDQHRLRSALVKCGYDEQCARRVMGEDILDRTRASALLGLLRPQWRDPSIEVEQRPTDEVSAMARATSRTTSPLDLE